MSSGRVGAVSVSATTNTTLFTVPSSTGGSLEIVVNVCNRNATAITYRLALLNGAIGTLANEDYIEYGVEVAGYGLVRSGGIVMAVGDVLVVYSDTANVTFQAWSK